MTSDCICEVPGPIRACSIYDGADAVASGARFIGEELDATDSDVATMLLLDGVD